jgi:hypothetical protein
VHVWDFEGVLRACSLFSDIFTGVLFAPFSLRILKTGIQLHGVPVVTEIWCWKTFSGPMSDLPALRSEPKRSRKRFRRGAASA